MVGRTLVGAAIAAVATIGIGGSVAFAGEVTGNGKGTPILAHEGPEDRVGAAVVSPSACAFSGLEDTPDGGPGAHPQTPAGSTAPGDEAGAFTGIACRGPAEGRVND